ncbi:MAG: hypothetical protein MUF49_28360, partial [Oculatellaceae cyanobacterium Prado106]|nr:hypothetical protein [Oculatellaceae cyanobacterium Prado106]
MEKIAVVGLSCLFPGAETPAEFWQNLIDQKNTTSLATEAQTYMGVDPEMFFDPEKGKVDRYYCLRGGFIQNFQFNPQGYRVPAAALQQMDSIFQWALYTSHQALIDSGAIHQEALLDRCGVILGNLSSPTRYSQRLFQPIYRQTVEAAIRDLLQQESFNLEGLPLPEGIDPLNLLTASYPSTLAAQALGLGGGGLTLDAACASPLYAVQLACDYLISRKADLMLAGAVSCSDPFVTHMGFSLYRAYPSNGLGQPLDQNSGGLNTGEGAGMLALKRYDDALRDGDRIYATILGVGLSNDGKGKHFLVPSSKGQVLAFERAYAEAGIDPKSIEYVECHATGTDLGDKTELNSMEEFFGPHGGEPRIGSVKSNLGHLLTAAGVPSLVKVILSMVNETIPATISVEQPLSSKNNVIGSHQVVCQNQPWPSQNPVKRAAVSAFGFGGTNAHLVLERQLQPQPDPVPPTPPTLEPMAIIGMGAHFGGCEDLDALDRTIYDGKQHFIPVPPEKWKGIDDHTEVLKRYGFPEGKAPLGAYIEDLEMDLLRFKIQPNRPDEPIPQQLLIVKAADAAIQDAGLPEGGNVAVLIAMETDASAHQYRARCDTLWQIKASLEKSGLSLPPDKAAELEDLVRESICYGAQVNRYISFVGNIMASRISETWDFTGPSFTVSAGENGTFKALELAQMMLSQGKVDAVVVGAVDVAQAESILIHQQLSPSNTGTPTLSFDRHSNGWLVGEGAGAIVLKRSQVAQQENHRIYATVSGIGIAQRSPQPNGDQTPDPSAILEATQQAMQQAQVSPDQIGYVEAYASGIAAEDAAEIQALTQLYRSESGQLSCGLGSIKANIGHTQIASGIASLIKAALCVYHRYIPATPQWSEPKALDSWQGSAFYVPTASQLWPLPSALDRRYAAVNSLGTIHGSYAHVILAEDLTQVQRPNRYLQQLPLKLFPLVGRDRTDLLQQLAAFEQTLVSSTNLSHTATQTFLTFQEQTSQARSQAEPPYVLSLLGQSKEDLLKEIQRAHKGLIKSLDQGKDWQTPAGSYCAAVPLGQSGTVASVYPGAFTAYVGVGQDLPHLYSMVYDDFLASHSTPAVRQLFYDINCSLYPRSLRKLTARELEQADADLANDAVIMLASGIMMAVVSTEILKHYFKLKPVAAFGYSLGEYSMMFATGISKQIDGGARNVTSSDLFTDRLSGPKNTVREFWGLPQVAPGSPDDIWGTFALLTPVEQVRQAIQQEPRVYLTHVNTPQEVVIAGDKQACQRVIDQLGCDCFPLDLGG